MLKNHLITLLFSLICFCSFAQTDETYFYINGISSKDDIGGVTTDKVYWSKRGVDGYDYAGYDYKLTNNNSFKVTVTYSIQDAGRYVSGSLSLNPNESKTVKCDNGQSIRTITRRMLSSTDVANELTKYKALLDQGVISQSEFDKIKSKLLKLL